jgi:hypothetical protein
MASNTLEALDETANDVEHQRAVVDRFAKVGEGVRHVLEMATVLRDGQVSLAEVAKLGVEVEGARLLVPKELVLERKRGVASYGVLKYNGFHQVSGDGAGDPRLDDVIHVAPVRKVGRRVVLEDVILLVVLADDEELVAPVLAVLCSYRR